MLLLIIAFLAGVLTIFAPCVLPVIPVIIGGSISGGKKAKIRPYLIGASLAFSIIIFTLLLKFSTYLIGISPSVLNWISGILLLILGLVALWPEIWEKFVVWLNWQAASQRFLGKGERNKDQYIGPILIGIALGPVFASCSPTYAFILASVLPISFFAGFIYLVTYSTGLAVALLFISLGGKKLIDKYSWAVDTHSIFRRSLGLLFIIIGICIIAGYQVRIETWVAGHLPFDETKIERVLLEKQQKSHLIHSINNSLSRASVLNVQPTQAPELQGLTNWINTSPLNLQQLKGKVVLVDFWTFSCINCIRSIPFVESWYQNYSKQGLVIIGVNTPEFAFEHDPNNVASAVKKYDITYPVALDNNYQTWNAFQNTSWPADYLIDKSGNIRYVSLGEGDYNKTEEAIQVLLGTNKPINSGNYTVPISNTQSPETYFGTNRAKNYIGDTPLNNGVSSFSPSNSLPLNNWTLSGSWNISSENITSNDSNSTIQYNAQAKDIYLVASSSNNQPANVSVSLPSGQSDEFGNDVVNGSVTISNSRLYHIVSLKQFGNTTVKLNVPKGVSLYTFTFGS